MTIKLLLSGGLGNQLFQFAAAKSLAIRRETKLEINLRFFPSIGPLEKRCSLPEFNIDAQFVDPALPLLGRHSLVHRIYRKLISEQSRFRYHEPSMGFHAEVLDLCDGTTVSGLFQSHLYFAEHEQEIRSEVDLLPYRSFPKSFKGWNYCDLIGLHVRRGDYLQHSGFELPNAAEYYSAAIDAAKRLLPKAPVLVFSDDIEWCREQDCFHGAIFHVFDETPKQNTPLLDMFCMSQCAVLIISNSTYSWWAAWLSGRQNAKVFAPFIWLDRVPVETIRVLPNEWEIVSWKI